MIGEIGINKEVSIMETTLNRVRNAKFDFELSHDKLQLITDYKPGTVILCHRGVLWVTQSGDLEDYVLEPGREFTSDQPGDVLIQAIRDAALSIRAPEVGNSIRSSVLHRN
jgi:hypothetical protein